MKKILAIALALTMLLALAACGQNSAPAETSAPTTPTTEPAVETAAPITAGNYNFAYVDIYGDTSRVTVRLNEDGSFDIMTLGAIGVANVHGIEWTDNGDGTFTTGALLEIPAADFFGADGSVTWTLIDDQKNMIPVGYVEPTEFEEKPEPTEEVLPENMYKYKETAFLPTDWTLEILDDGTFKLSETNPVVGYQEYVGKIISQEGNTLICGPLEGNKPGVDNWCTPADGFTVELGDGTFEPIGVSEENLPPIGDSDLPPMDGEGPDGDGPDGDGPNG